MTGPKTWLKWAAWPGWSRVMGTATNASLPGALLEPAIRTYARIYGIDLDQAERDVSEFRTFNEFFTRRLKAGLRPVDQDPAVAVWPADGNLVSQGDISGDPHTLAIEVKGIAYPLDRFLGDPAAAAGLAQGGYLVIHLTPADYHRVHAPMDLAIEGYRHLPGLRYPVNRLGLESGAAVYTENERVVIRARSGADRIHVVLVAAFGVGGVSLAFDAIPAGREEDPFPIEKTYQEPVNVRKGEELGAFHMGSSVVLVWSAGCLKPDQPGPDRAVTGKRMGVVQASGKRSS